MGDESVIFSSKITRNNVNTNNNLSELLQVLPARPISPIIVKQNTCDYIPKSDKYYIPKKKSGLKVKTVKNIRNEFEQDIYSNLAEELEKQRKVLLTKIRNGSSKNVSTKEIAKNILTSSTPISKSTWHMLMNINPYEHCNSFQYVLCNGKFIQVNGSKGGKNKLMSKYDIGKVFKKNVKSTYLTKNNLPFVQRKGLLENSLNVKFKPGPLTRKKFLDTSYLKHQFGDMELVSLPKPGLEIQTGYGKPLGPIVTTFLYKSFMQDSVSVISEKWAEFAASVLGNNARGKVQSVGSNISFDLNYKCLQNRILMRHDSDIINNKVMFNNTSKNKDRNKEDSVLFSEIEKVLSDLIQAVDISINQDNMYTGEEEPREVSCLDDINANSQFKEKQKKRYCELDRLDVTVIRITETSDKKGADLCKNASCTFGCVCNSLKCDYKLKSHCGRIECMFMCKCDISCYEFSNESEECSDLLPTLINIDRKGMTTLAKEEQKFHQTVIVTNDKSILLKSRKRDWKSSKKYADFYTNMRLKPEPKLVKELSVVALKLNCSNVEPLCMVHNLYKCFCNGKYTTTALESAENPAVNEPTNLSVLQIPNPSNQDCLNDEKTECLNYTNNNRTTLKRNSSYESQQVQRRISEDSVSDNNEIHQTSNQIYNADSCARVDFYKRRKYKDSYYLKTNQKILEMEKNDSKLHNKLLNIMKKCAGTDSNDVSDTTDHNTFSQVSSLKDLLNNIVEENMQCTSTDTSTEDTSENPSVSRSKRLPHKTKIVSWLESSYKQYKLRAGQGVVKTCLDPPKAGKMALYPWDFILSRYRERKNHFLISPQKPFRIFMTVDLKKYVFENCINIRDIALCDLDKYPITVKNLISNATNLLDNFCILYGLKYCWELIGSVTKVNEPRIDKLKDNEIETTSENWTSVQMPQENETKGLENNQLPPDNIVQLNKSCSNVSLNDTSKWFLMTVENDFTEIQFYEKGFFVRYDSVIKAINVARSSGKTVRLSAQNHNNQQNDAQFGIYAIPNNNRYSVFIGPYDKDEKLGIETVKTFSKVENNRTRGVWIITNKVDNVKVIDNPLSFMVSANIGNEKMIPLESNCISTINISPVSSLTKIKDKSESGKQTYKSIKPIKIKKTNGQYYLSSNSFLRQESVRLRSTENINIKIIDSTVVSKSNDNITSTGDDKNKMENKTTTLSLLKAVKPVAEIAPQVKTYNNKKKNLQKKHDRRGMFVLNPEEINKRSLEKAQLKKSSEFLMEVNNSDIDTILHLDIEKFLATSVVKPAPNSDIYVISDDEDENSPKQSYVNVYIVCQNIKNIGWIPGKRNSNGYISFTFPGFKETEFYPEKVAFEKIVQVMSRKVYIPKWINLEWQVCESEADVKSKPKLELKDLQSDYVMTKQGLRRKFAVTNANSFNSLLQPASIIFSSDSLTQEESLLRDIGASSFLKNDNDDHFDATEIKQTETTDYLCLSPDDEHEETIESLNDSLWDIEDMDGASDIK